MGWPPVGCSRRRGAGGGVGGGGDGWGLGTGLQRGIQHMGDMAVNRNTVPHLRHAPDASAGVTNHHRVFPASFRFLLPRRTCTCSGGTNGRSLAKDCSRTLIQPKIVAVH